MTDWFVYIIEKNEKLYTGITTDPPNRMRQDGAAEPLYIEDPLSKSAAASRERQLKGLSREKKLSLISGGSSQQR